MPRTRENVYAYRYSSKYFILNLGLSRFSLIFIPERDNKFHKNLAFTMVFFTALSIGCREIFYGNCHLSIKHERAIILLMLTPTHYWSVFQKLKTTVAEYVANYAIKEAVYVDFPVFSVYTLHVDLPQSKKFAAKRNYH